MHRHKWSAASDEYKVQVDKGDYIDIGKLVADGKVLPVLVKTVVFNVSYKHLTLPTTR